MPRRRLQIFTGMVIAAVALMAALAFESVYDVSIRARPADPLAAAASSAPSPHAQLPLDLRLADSGGVGIPLEPWGTDYSHDRRTFREVILQDPPYVDAHAFQRVEREWRQHVERMLAYGNNAIAVPLFLELIDFDRVRMPAGSDDGIYPHDSPFRARHAAVRRHFSQLFAWAAQQGMQIFLETDMLTLTRPLADHLRRVAPDRSAAGSRAAGILTSDPAVWDVYRAGLDELFDALPSVGGLVVRFGEGGRLYNTDGWPYRSEMAVRDAASVRAMLRGLLPVFEGAGRTLVLRSWTVGVGAIGRLHIDPQIFDAVLGDIDSPALIVSTKLTAGDFFSYLPLNPTLARGRHRRLIELQARPEFEGFAAFPDFLGAEYARAIRAFRAANPRIAGTYVFTQFGGPLRAGPRALYPLHGFWWWGDANVFAASRLAVDSGARVDLLVREWAARTFGDEPAVVDAVASALIETREAVLKGFYIQPFAERQVLVPGLELPPLMWIFEWDMVGGWHSLLSLVYRASRESVERAVEEGDAAADVVRRARQRLQSAVTAADPKQCAALCADALESLEYQESLFDVLAAWRQAFLSYYHWLDGGGAAAWRDWRTGRTRFETAATDHLARYGGNLDFPAFDLASARRMIAIADRSPWIRSLAGGLLMALCVLAVGGRLARRSSLAARTSTIVATGRLTWIVTLAPWRLDRESIELSPALAVTALSLAAVGVLVGALTGFAVPWISAGTMLLCAIVAVAFAGTAGGATDRGRVGMLVAAVGPLLPGSAILLGLIAYAGPLGFWYGFWTSAVFRVAFLTILIATILWPASVMLTVRGDSGWSGRISGLLAAGGAWLIALTVLLPDTVVALRALDRPLNVAPATDTILFALQTYAGVSLGAGGRPALLGVLLLVGGWAMRLRSSGRRSKQQIPLVRFDSPEQ